MGIGHPMGILASRPKDWLYPSDQATIGDRSTSLDAKKLHLVSAKNDQVFC